jgi:predicted ABC-type ATPase
MSNKELIIAAGPNGAGKTTFVTGYLSELKCPYLSADLIATEFRHLEPMERQIAAGREFLVRSETQLIAGGDFIVESTISGRSLRKFLERAKAAQYHITIFFVYLDSADTCVARVRQRVRRGGHDVPEEDIRRRFTRSLANFWHLYREIADYWYIVYNSIGEYKWIASGDTESTVIHLADEFKQFLQLAGVDDDKAVDQS